jgi:2-keto-3-deoxy-L-rhamnonate aldolase RhmA
MDEAVAIVAQAAAAHGKAWGRTAGSVAELKRYQELGAQMVPWGGDFALMNVLRDGSQDLDQILGD